MAFIPVENTVQVEFIFNYGGQVAENVIYVKKAAAWDEGIMTTLASSLKTWWDANCKANSAASVSLQRIKVTDLTTQTSPIVEYSTGLPITGTNASPPLPNNVSCAITFVTGNRGRSYRGRNYIIGLCESGVDGNSLGAGTMAAWLAAYAALKVVIDGLGYAHVVVSRYTNNQPRINGVATTVTSYRSDGYVDSQRRRLPGRGN